MAKNGVPVIDCDGHLIESIPEMAEYMDPGIRGVAVAPNRNRQGVFPSLDGFHYPGSRGIGTKPGKERVTASEHRTGSEQDWLAFLEKTGVEQAVMFTTEGLSVGMIQLSDYAVRVCRAYNDYVADRYRRLSNRLHPVALIPMQDVSAAVLELRRAVKDLGLPGAMLPATGLPLHLGHEHYWPLYKEAADLDCFLGVHGGGNRSVGMDSFSDFIGSHVLHHPIPLMIALVSYIYHGVLDRFPTLRVAFLEGGCAWLTVVMDRMERDDELMGSAKRTFPDYMAGGQLLIGCEGNDRSLPYLAGQVGVEPFAYSSDYPHEVDLVAAQHEIQETLERPELTQAQKEAVLSGNARRFFRM
jgi:predicted TIM-barrel fold metal-dependent hydrolase